MGLFKSREENFEEQQERKKFAELQEDQEWKEEQQEYIKEIEVAVRRNNTVICYCTDDCDFKQAAMNYLFEKGYVCVQNDVASAQYPPDYILTFVKRDFANCFIVNKH